MNETNEHGRLEPEGVREKVPPTNTTAVATGGNRPRTALVAGCDRREVEAITRGLEEQGIHATPAHNRQEALAALEDEVPGVLVADTDMPELGGIEFANMLRADPSTVEVTIVLISSGTSDATVFRAWSSGVEAFLTTPLRVHEIVATVLQVLGD